MASAFAAILGISSVFTATAVAAATAQPSKVNYPLYGISELAANWNFQRGTGCGSQLKNLYYALRKRETWALRLLDSSGAPRSGFVWGNNYWLGTYSQCRWVSSKQAVLPPKASPSKSLDFPPFAVDFYVGSFKHNSSYQAQMNVPQEDLILIGLCLPSACSIEQVETLLSSWVAQDPLTVQYLYNFTMKLHNVRLIKQEAVTDCPMLLILSFTVGLVFLLVVSATFYDVHSSGTKRRRCEFAQGSSKSSESDAGKIRNIRESDELLTRDNNLNEGYELKIDNSLHKSIPAPVSVELSESEAGGRRRHFKKSLKEIFVCFSAASNANSILDTNSSDKGSVPAIHGLRFFAMMSIICMYTVHYLKDFADNKPLLLRISQGFSQQLISNSALSVDTFFFTSGFLLSYIYHKNRRGSSRLNDTCSVKRKVNEFFYMFVNRLIRLTPVYVVVLILANVTITRNNKMSLFEVTELSQNVCDKYWWRNLLFINNLFKADEMCMSWSWYLSTEMQFFTLGSALLITSSRFWKFSAALTAALIMVSSLMNGYSSYVYSFSSTLDQQLASLHVLHYPPWARVGPYLIGMCTGYFAIHLKGEFTCNRATLITCWVVGSICNLWPLLGLYNKDMSIVSTALYNALSRPAWGFGLAWIVIACTTENGGALNSLLSFRGWTPMSKLSFTSYLLSPLLINLTYSSSETPMHLDFFPVVVYFFGFTGLTYFCAYLLSLTIEQPFNRLGKFLTGQKNLINQLSQH